MSKHWGWAAAGALALAVQAAFAFWFLQAYVYKPMSPCGGECPRCCRQATAVYNAALRDQNAFQRVGSPTVGALWIGTDLALLGAALWTLDRPRKTAPPWWQLCPDGRHDGQRNLS